jgi:hypothetical protein
VGYFRTIVVAAALLTLIGCGDGSAETDVTGVEVTGDAGQTDTSTTPPDTVTKPQPISRLVVFDTMSFTKELEAGIAPGFNLDGLVSDHADEESCGQLDYTSPEGVPGVDNQLAKLYPFFELVGVGAVEGLIQSVIEEGGLLFMMQFDGIDDFLNDDEISLIIRTGQGVPLLGTDGKILAGQTFHIHPESPDTVTANARIEDGVIYAGPFTATLPLRIFGMDYQLTLFDTQIRAEWTEDGGLTSGIFGGGVSIEELYAIGETAAKDDASVLAAIKILVKDSGDLAPDENGECQQVSAAFSFTSVSAFYFEDEPGAE